MTEETIKGTIISAEYSEDFDTITWEVETEEGEVVSKTWKRRDFGWCLGICKKGQLMPVKLLEEWLPKFVGKSDVNIKFIETGFNAPDLHQNQIHDMTKNAQEMMNFVADQTGKQRVQVPKYKPKFIDPIIGL